MSPEDGLRLSLALPSFGPVPAGGWPALAELARRADEAGVDRVVVSDHLVMGPHPERYPWGTFPTASDAPWLEPLTVLTAMAAVTSRVRLATGILIAPLRPAAVLAKTVATLDQLSGGRVDLGVGTGWQREEFEAVGLDHTRRGQLLTDTMAACRALWAPSPATFTSPTTAFADIYCDPKPAQARLPVLFSGTLTDRNRRRIVDLGDGWIPIMGATLDDIGAGVETIRQDLAAAGRDPARLRVQGHAPLRRGDDGEVDLAATFAVLPRLRALGVTDVQVTLRHLGRHPADIGAAMRRLVEEFHHGGQGVTSPRELAERYASCVDHLDGAGAAALFAPDGVLVVPPTPGGRDTASELVGREVIARALGGLGRYLATMHAVVGHVLEPAADAGRDAGRDLRRGVTSCRAHHIWAEDGRLWDRVMTIRYDDTYTVSEGTWLFAARRLNILWLEDRPVTAVRDRSGEWIVADA